MPFLTVPLPGSGALTSQECDSVVSGKVTNSYWVVQDFPDFSIENVEF